MSAAAEVLSTERRSRGGAIIDIWRRFRRNRLAVAGLAIAVLLVVIALLQPLISPYDPFEQNLRNTLQPPNADHWFGTDVLGRDLYSGILYGLRLALIVGISTVAGSLLVGVTLGGIAGYFGKLTDALIMRATDIFLAFPLLIGSILIVQIFGSSLPVVIIALVVLGWPVTARLMRGQVLAVGQAEYVEAARAIGASSTRVFLRHILPNAVGPVLIYAFTSVGVAVVALASLAFLGVGVPADTPEWGRMVAQAVGLLKVDGKAYLWLFPALAITLFTLAFALVADGLRDALDPRLR